MIKAKVVMIGANLKGIETELKHSGIRCTELISGCSPLSMTGKHDESVLKLSRNVDDMPTLLDIKKNLSQMLSRNPDFFVQNYNTIPYGKNVDYVNPAEYIIVSNTGLACEILFNGEYIYTARSGNEFYAFIGNDASYRRISPLCDEFDWRSHYERFVDTILNEYDGRHIILIRTNTPKYYMDGNEIKQFGTEYDKLGKLIAEADGIFAEKTNCIEVYDSFSRIPQSYNAQSLVPFAEFDGDCVYDISRTVEDIIFNGNIPRKPDGLVTDINNIISLYCEYENTSDKSSFALRVKRLFADKNALPIIKAKKLRENNLKYLSEYPYLSEDLKQAPNDESVYICLGNAVYIVLDPTSETPVSKLMLPMRNTPDYKTVIKNGYVCSLAEADALCGSLAFYIERARRGDGNHPIRVAFDLQKDFYKSLNYVDYPDMLENERFLLCLKKDAPYVGDYKARCDLSFFFDPDVKICALDNGLGDQITHYIFAKRLEDYTGSEIYYDDLVYYFDYIMNDREIDNVIKEDISGRVFSNIFTRRLLLNFSIGDVIPDKLAENGLREMTVIANNDASRGNAVRKCNKICLCSIQHDYIDKILSCGLYPLYFNYYIRPEWLMTLRPFELREYLKFPKAVGKNKEIENKMLGCDAVAVQVRRGDFVRLGWDSDTSFYAEAIDKLSTISDYPNKKYFVFSDDMPWVRAHSKEMGLYPARGEIVYVDFNKAEDCLFDMYLISLAKVVIGSASGFVKVGVLFSSRCEDFFCSNVKVKKVFEAIGRKNKHDFEFICGAIPNYSVSPKIRKSDQKQNAI